MLRFLSSSVYSGLSFRVRIFSSPDVLSPPPVTPPPERNKTVTRAKKIKQRCKSSQPPNPKAPKSPSTPEFFPPPSLAFPFPLRSSVLSFSLEFLSAEFSWIDFNFIKVSLPYLFFFLFFYLLDSVCYFLFAFSHCCLFLIFSFMWIHVQK